MSRITVMGIDPGREGGFAVLDGDSVIVEPMPQVKDGRIDVKELYRLLAHYSPVVGRVYVERAGLRPGQNVTATFTTGLNHGYLEAVLALVGASEKIVVLRPDIWAKHYKHGVKERDPHKRYREIKRARRRIVAELYPGIDLRKNDRCEFPHEGMVDALLIADYGWRTTNNINSP